GRDDLLAGERAGEGEDRDDLEEPPQPHRGPTQCVPEDGVASEAGEGTAVVADLRGEGVEDLAESMRARIERPSSVRRGRGREHGDGRKSQDDEDVDQDGKGGEADLLGLDLLAEILWGSSNHEAGDEDREDG